MIILLLLLLLLLLYSCDYKNKEYLKLQSLKVRFLVKARRNHDYLHWTTSLATSEVALPALLFATHRYSPLLFLFILVIVNCLLSALKKILASSLVSTDSPLNHDITGSGSPLALQDKVMFLPSVTVVFCGCVVIWGATIINSKARTLILVTFSSLQIHRVYKSGPGLAAAHHGQGIQIFSLERLQYPCTVPEVGKKYRNLWLSRLVSAELLNQTWTIT